MKSLKARQLLAKGLKVSEVAKELKIKNPGWIYALNRRMHPIFDEVKALPKAQATNGRVGHYFIDAEFPLAFASEEVGRKYVGDTAKLTKVSVLLY
jgi:hypothetical protein